MAEQNVFDFDEAIRRRDRGIRQVAHNNHLFLKEARMRAIELAKIRGEITCDDIRELCSAIDLEPANPNVWGALFKDKRFEFTGKYKRSALVQGHGNLQRVWRLK